MSFVEAPSAIEGMRMYPANLLMSRTSTMIVRPSGLFIAASIFRTSPILLAMMVSALVFLNCS